MKPCFWKEPAKAASRKRPRRQKQRLQNLPMQETNKDSQDTKNLSKEEGTCIPMLQAVGLTYCYGEHPALTDVNVSIFSGERIAVMGSNGAGKSTFFLNLNGVLPPTGGELYLEGKKIGKKELVCLREKVGFVFQDADSQMLASNVMEEISFGPMNLGLEQLEVKRRVQEAAACMELEELLQRAPHHLSGGEKKRVSIADILAMEPKLLIFDEPMASLDPVNAQKTEEIFERLHQQGKTLMIATHDMDFAYRFASRILVFSKGRLLADGVPEDIFLQKEIMEEAHLKPPAAWMLWRALEEAGIAPKEGKYAARPRTAEEIVRRITTEL